MITNSEFESALRRFDEFMLANQLLGEYNYIFPESRKLAEIDQALPLSEKIDLYVEELKGWIMLKSQELDEFDGEDLVRLRGEAVGCMYALRELRRFFQEAR